MASYEPRSTTEGETPRRSAENFEAEDKASVVVVTKPWKQDSSKIGRLIQLNLLIIFAGKGIIDSAASPGIYDKICRKAGREMYPYNEVDCSNLKNYEDDFQSRVKSENADMNIYLSLSTSIIPCVASLIFSAWGDRAGRKTNVLLGVTGLMLWALINIIYLQIHGAPIYLIPVVNIFIGFTGMHTLVLTSSIQYIADIEENKEVMIYRAMLVSAASSIGQVIGHAICSAVLKKHDSARAMLIGQGFMMAGFAVAATFYEQRRPLVNTTSSENGDAGGEKKPLKWILSLLRDIVTTYTRKRQLGRRLAFWLVLGALCFASVGNLSFVSTYLLSPPLSFSASRNSVFQAVNGAVIAVGSVIGSIAAIMLKLIDPTLAAVSLVSLTLSRLPLALAKDGWEVFLSPVVGCFGYLYISSFQAMISKIVMPHEIGKGLAGEAVCTSISIVIGDIILNKVFSATTDSYQPAAFFVSMGFTFIAFLLSIAVYMRSKDLPEIQFKVPARWQKRSKKNRTDPTAAERQTNDQNGNSNENGVIN